MSSFKKHPALSLLFAVAVSVASANNPQPNHELVTESVLLGDDQCQAGDEQCALNALQRRGISVTSAGSASGTDRYSGKDEFEDEAVADEEWLPSIFGTTEKCCRCKNGKKGWSASGKCSFCMGFVAKKKSVASTCTKKSKSFKGSRACANACSTAVLVETEADLAEAHAEEEEQQEDTPVDSLALMEDEVVADMEVGRTEVVGQPSSDSVGNAGAAAADELGGVEASVGVDAGAIAGGRHGLKVMTWNIHNGYPIEVREAQGRFNSSFLVGKRTIYQMMSTIRSQSPSVLGLQEVAFLQSTGPPTSGYLDKARFEQSLRRMGYQLAKCSALTDEHGRVILWNYLAVKSSLRAGSFWSRTVSSGEEKRCLVGARVTHKGQQLDVATIHLAVRSSSAMSQLQRAASSLAARSSPGGTILFGDFNHPIGQVMPTLAGAGFKTRQSSSDPYTGMKQHRVIDQVWFKDVSLRADHPRRLDACGGCSDHFPVVAVFS